MTDPSNQGFNWPATEAAMLAEQSRNDADALKAARNAKLQYEREMATLNTATDWERQAGPERTTRDRAALGYDPVQMEQGKKQLEGQQVGPLATTGDLAVRRATRVAEQKELREAQQTERQQDNSKGQGIGD